MTDCPIMSQIDAHYHTLEDSTVWLDMCCEHDEEVDAYAAAMYHWNSIVRDRYPQDDEFVDARRASYVITFSSTL